MGGQAWEWAVEDSGAARIWWVQRSRWRLGCLGTEENPGKGVDPGLRTWISMAKLWSFKPSLVSYCLSTRSWENGRRVGRESKLFVSS